MKDFYTIWIGQTLSSLGSALVGFSLKVWIFQQTGSIMDFSLATLFTEVPTLLIGPFAGVLADRYNKKRIIVISDVGALFSSILLAVLFSMGKLEVWHVYFTNLLNSICNAFQWPAFQASFTQIVKKEDLEKATSMMEISDGLIQLVTPLIASLFLAHAENGIYSLLFLDLLTFSLGMISVYLVKFGGKVVVKTSSPTADAPATTANNEEDKEIVPATFDLRVGWDYIRCRKGLLTLTILFFLLNLSLAYIAELIPPLILTIAGVEELGYSISFAGTGALIASVVTGVWGVPKAKVLTITLGMFLTGVLMLGSGGQASCPLIAVIGFAIMFIDPFITVSYSYIWTTKVHPSVQGRVFSIRRVIALSGMPLAALSAGPLVEKYFDPWMSEEGMLSNSVGAIIGTGKGRGISLLLILCGILLASASIVAFCIPKYRNLQRDLPDFAFEKKEE